MGTLRAIWIKRGKGAPMDAVEAASLVEGHGIEGNANAGGRRAVTLIDQARWSDACRELGADIDPRLRRANLMVDGVDLEGTRGRVLCVGAARIRIGGETTPCRLMDEQHPGLQEALRPHWRGGAYGTVESGGTIRVDDPVRWDGELTESASRPAGNER